MFVSMKWVQEFVNLDGLNLEELIHRFTLSTAEVENIIYKGKNISGIVIAKILSVENHPKSKKLHILKIDTGEEILPCVCGAPNVRKGMIVAFAKVSSNVNGNRIECVELAGYKSCGMCCSEAELGISDKNSGIMELNLDGELGTDIGGIVDFEDTVFEVDNKSLTNRPDLWGIYGIAREFAAISNRKLKPIDLLDCSVYKNLPKIDINLLSSKTLRYSSIKIENITQNNTPLNIKTRLFYCGLKSKNLIVDLTNYVMLEIGQPMHAFDGKIVKNIQIKHFNQPFVFKTLDGINRNIDENTMMVCSNNKPIAIAGIMGGFDSEIHSKTSSILLESATFDAISIRKSSNFLSCRTDASTRFEKKLDTNMTVDAIGRFLKIFLEIDSKASVVSCLSDICVKTHKPLLIDLDKEYLNRYTGIEISNNKIIKIFKSLGFEIKDNDGNFKIVVPTFRSTKDINIKADLVEEITRIYGYDNFEIKPATGILSPTKLSPEKSLIRQIKNFLVTRYNMHEVNSYIWCDEARYKEIGIDIEPNVKILNSINPNFSTLRSSMIPTLLSFIYENREFEDDFGIFEIGSVLSANGVSGGDCIEKRKLGLALFSKTKSSEKLFFDLLNILSDIIRTSKNCKTVFKHVKCNHHWQHPNNTVAVEVNSKNLGFISVLHPSILEKINKKSNIVFAQLDFDLFSSIKKQILNYKKPYKFPNIKVDLSLVLNKDKIYSNISNTIENLNVKYLKNIRLIDTFKLDDEKIVLTIRLNFASDEKTLVHKEVQLCVDQIIESLEKKNIFLKS
ncbi:MAG: phenylalanine--tRNA ligase subunit beta [Oscillospiraceae bacterium]|jgi:phenylalanyl-tRNA synthetase beta chain|nr:phenylalanine--tRNA ligase subunit beta [Oscillospiraceae bacterium]